jgi:hypothetical protein
MNNNQQQENNNMLINDLKEGLSDSLDYLENCLDSLDKIKNQDQELINWYHELVDIHEVIRLKIIKI